MSPGSNGSTPLNTYIETYLRELHQGYALRAVYADPYQLHRSITTLQRSGVRIQEFAQTQSNLTRMGQALFDLLNGRNIQLYSAIDLRHQALDTIAIETPRGWRIAKEKAAHV